MINSQQLWPCCLIILQAVVWIKKLYVMFSIWVYCVKVKFQKIFQPIPQNLSKYCGCTVHIKFGTTQQIRPNENHCEYPPHKKAHCGPVLPPRLGSLHPYLVTLPNKTQWGPVWSDLPAGLNVYKTMQELMFTVQL